METCATLIKFMTSMCIPVCVAIVFMGLAAWFKINDNDDDDDDELKQRLLKVWHGLRQSVTDTMDEWHKHLWACIDVKRGHFEHLIWLESTHILMFRSKSIVLNTSTVLPLFIFRVSQGSAITYFRCGWKYDTSLVANLLLSPTVTEFLKPANISQSYERISSDTFFMDHGVDREHNNSLDGGHYWLTIWMRLRAVHALVWAPRVSGTRNLAIANRSRCAHNIAVRRGHL